MARQPGDARLTVDLPRDVYNRLLEAEIDDLPEPEQDRIRFNSTRSRDAVRRAISKRLANG